MEKQNKAYKKERRKYENHEIKKRKTTDDRSETFRRAFYSHGVRLAKGKTRFRLDQASK